MVEPYGGEVIHRGRAELVPHRRDGPAGGRAADGQAERHAGLRLEPRSARHRALNDAQRAELERLTAAQAYHALAGKRLREAGAHVPPAAA